MKEITICETEIVWVQMHREGKKAKEAFSPTVLPETFAGFYF